MSYTRHWTVPDDVRIQEIDERHDLSQQLFFRRDHLEWSQSELADRAGLTQAQVARFEAGHSNPTLKTLTKLAHAFGCRVAEILTPGLETAVFGADPEAFEWLFGYSEIGSSSPVFDVKELGEEEWIYFGEFEWLEDSWLAREVARGEREAGEYKTEDDDSKSPTPLAA